MFRFLSQAGMRRSVFLALQSQRAFRASYILLRREANHYQLLGVAPTASEKEIKMQYFRMAQKYHPDHNPDD